jgi:hypothetical protein
MGRRAGFSHRYRPVAGCRHHTGDLRVIVSFDDDTFAEINEGARINDCSFSSQVRMLIEVGLETLKLDSADLAIADTHPQGGDAKQAPFMSGGAAKQSPNTPSGTPPE